MPTIYGPILAICDDVPGARGMLPVIRGSDCASGGPLQPRCLPWSQPFEAELRAALARAKSPWSAELVAPIDWILPSRLLGPEMDRVLQAGYLRGADLWHVACALYLAGGLGPVTFMSLDGRPREVARELGMPAPEA